VCVYKNVCVCVCVFVCVCVCVYLQYYIMLVIALTHFLLELLLRVDLDAIDDCTFVLFAAQKLARLLLHLLHVGPCPAASAVNLCPARLAFYVRTHPVSISLSTRVLAPAQTRSCVREHSI